MTNSTTVSTCHPMISTRKSVIASLLPDDRPRSFCIVSDNARTFATVKINASNLHNKRHNIRRAKSTSSSRDSLPRKPYSSKRALPYPHNRRRHARRGSSDDASLDVSPSSVLSPISVSTANGTLSRWSSTGAVDTPYHSSNGMTMNHSAPPQRRSRNGSSTTRHSAGATTTGGGLSSHSRAEILHNLAASSSSSSRPPSMPTRKFLDDDSEKSCTTEACATASHNIMTLTSCLAVHANKNHKAGGKMTRSIRRHPVSNQESEEKRRSMVSILDAALGSLDLCDQ